MSVPHRCPVCYGTGSVKQAPPLPGSTSVVAITYPCHACSGGGIVWEPTVAGVNAILRDLTPGLPDYARSGNPEIDRVRRERAEGSSPDPVENGATPPGPPHTWACG